MKRLIILTTLCTLLSRCSINYEEYFEKYQKFTKFPLTEKWEFKRFSEATYFLPPQIMIVNKDYLVVLTNIDGELIQIYDINDARLLKSFGKKGQGPGEFIGVKSVPNNPCCPKKFCIFDITLRRLTLYNIDTVLNKNVFNPDSIIKISSDGGSPFYFCYLNNDTLVAMGVLKNRLCFYNSRGDTIKTAGYLPGKKENSISNFSHLQAYQGALNSNYYTKKIAICSFAGDLLEIYDSNGNILKTVHGPDLFIPEYETVQNHARVTSLMCGYFDLCSTSKYIYCNYSGERRNNKKDWTVALGKKIMVFDWAGNPIKRIDTDVRLGYIDVSEERNTIYAICYDGVEFFIGYHKL